MGRWRVCESASATGRAQDAQRDQVGQRLESAAGSGQERRRGSAAVALWGGAARAGVGRSVRGHLLEVARALLVEHAAAAVGAGDALGPQQLELHLSVAVAARVARRLARPRGRGRP
eukprot:CAMPEP_0202035898 /NCGR_PEP_ID=MMETSP0962-20130828/1209_1 /ASSEMBLY_ACC=CAM_ASM_000488 /TAXON_ID=4773 /ORGANISM="Schizochytrium aggregatum, Strain ATCC28209" /LENGTH=116 /DNA_ID=CAMNT_0048599949 /DNA_START=52 /DNA_END=399 /DNA_ORIENTATION=-